MKCDICKEDIGEDVLSQTTKVRMFDVLQKVAVEYHRPCWNKKASDRIREEDKWMTKKKKLQV